jgi:uncharacterized membrane protein
MGTLSVWRFETPDGAETAVGTLDELARGRLITVHDAATVRWDAGAKKPRTRQVSSLAGAGALGGAFWGLLFGMLFLMPLLGLAVGAAMGAFGGSLRGVGIDDDFIRRAREEVTPGTSALFLLTSGAVTHKVRDAFAGQRPHLLFTNLSDAQEQTLRDVFVEAA